MVFGNEADSANGTPKAASPPGLVVVSGSTASSKSQVVRGLIYQYLRECALGKRQRIHESRPRSHLVTFEDPIESFFADEPGTCLRAGIEYTPRQKEADADSLGAALADALRQTPEVFYVGEVRRTSDWRAVMDFAGSGHLILCTTHAGSLTETLQRVFSAVRADTRAERGQYANRIRAVVHQVIGGEVILPAVWRNTAPGVASLVSDGLSSIVPNCPKVPSTVSSIGRRWFANQFGRLLKERDRAEKHPEVEMEAVKRDLHEV